jgi:aspartyl protease
MIDFGRRAVIDAKINGQGPYRFVLGTAATITILDSALQKELALPVAEGIRAVPVGGQAPRFVTVQELRIGGAVLRDFDVAVLPLKNFEEGPGMPRGILSPTLFQGCLLTLHYPQGRVAFEKGKLDAADAQSIFEYAGIRPTVPVRIGDRELQVRLDSGSGYGLMLPTRYLKELQFASSAKEVGKTRTVAGDFPVLKARASAPVQLGRFTLDVPEVYFSDAGQGPPEGTLGYEVLRNFVLTLDCRNHRIRIAQ